jgi:hypothetical protein
MWSGSKTRNCLRGIDQSCGVGYLAADASYMLKRIDQVDPLIRDAVRHWDYVAHISLYTALEPTAAAPPRAASGPPYTPARFPVVTLIPLCAIIHIPIHRHAVHVWIAELSPLCCSASPVGENHLRPALKRNAR